MFQEMDEALYEDCRVRFEDDEVRTYPICVASYGPHACSLVPSAACCLRCLRYRLFRGRDCTSVRRCCICRSRQTGSLQARVSANC